MKAEHRKELQTNLLADRMGKMVERVRSGPSRRAVLVVVLAVIALAAYIGLTWYRSDKRREASNMWTRFGETEFLTRGGMMPWVKDNNNPGMAARFELAWLFLWDLGIKQMAANPTEAVKALKSAEDSFTNLREACKDDPVLGPESAYALAVIEEARAVGDRSHLDKAIARYKAVQRDYKESAAGKAAEQRLKYLETNRDQVVDFYAFAEQRLFFFAQLQQHLDNPKAFEKALGKEPEPVMPPPK